MELPPAPRWPQITWAHKHRPFINWTGLQKWGKVIYVGNLINRLPMNTHSYKTNKYEPFKTHQEKFLETFQMKRQQNNPGKGGAQPPSRAFANNPRLTFCRICRVGKTRTASPGLCPWSGTLCISSSASSTVPCDQSQGHSSSLLAWEEFQVRSSVFYQDKPQHTWCHVKFSHSSGPPVLYQDAGHSLVSEPVGRQDCSALPGFHESTPFPNVQPAPSSQLKGTERSTTSSKKHLSWNQTFRHTNVRENFICQRQRES